jgi:hypothetical protein
MERKDYAEKFMKVKNDILDEIRKLIPSGSVHYFSDTFYSHYIDGEVATTEICAAVEVDKNEMVIFHVRSEGYKTTEMVVGEEVYKYSSDTFLNILDHLQKEVREKKLDIIRELLKNNGGRIDVKENFEFLCADEGDKNNLSHSLLKGVSLDNDKILVKTIWKEDSSPYHYNEDCITNEELDNVITCLKSHMKQKFVIRVSGSYSRTFDIEASSYEEALEFAKTEWKEDAPLCHADSNGEDWEDYTSVTH